MQRVLRQPLPGHHVLQHRDVGGDVQRLVAEQAVQLLLKGQHDGAQHPLHLLHCAADVLAVNALTAQLVIAAQQLDGGGQVVGHKFPYLGQLLRVVLHIGEDTPADLLQPVDLTGHGLVLNAVVQGAHGLDRAVPVGDHLIQLRVAGGHRLLRDLHFLCHIPAEPPRNDGHDGAGRRCQQEMAHLVQRKQQPVQQPRHRRRIDGRSRPVDDGFCFQSCRLPSEFTRTA